MMERAEPGEFGSARKKTLAVFEMNNEFGLEFRKKQCFDCFFYADTEDDASNLVIELHKLGYEVGMHKDPGRRNWSIIGTTPEMSTDLDIVGTWSEEMDRLAKNNRADFDGWGSEAG
jgi:hypothetical protein